MLAIAAAMLATVALASVVLMRGEPQRTTVAAPRLTVAPEDFDRDVGALCVEVERSLIGLGPQFVTAEAYTVVAAQLRPILVRMGEGLARLRPPADDVALPQVALAKAHAAEAALADVEASVVVNDLTQAGTAWDDALRRTHEALSLLGEHGAIECPTSSQREGP